jgi:phosphohistidine phosphatase
MRVLIIRHATAVAHGTPGIPDEERPLTPRGEKRFRTAASGLARVVPRPDELIASPLPRAFRTAEIAAEAWGRVEVTTETALAGGSVDDVLALLASRPGNSRIALVGHEPQLSLLASRLLGGEDASRVAFRKGGACLIEIPGPPREGGSLVAFLPPRVLRALAR